MKIYGMLLIFIFAKAKFEQTHKHSHLYELSNASIFFHFSLFAKIPVFHELYIYGLLTDLWR